MLQIAEYQERVSLAMGKWQAGMRTEEALLDLAKLLGCYCVDRCRDNDLKDPDEPPEGYESSIAAALQNLLSMYVLETGESDFAIETTLIDGLTRNGRWPQSLNNVYSAYSISVVVLRFFEIGLISKARSYAEHAHYRTVAMALNKTLVDWLKPDVKDLVYNRRSFAGALFGEAWCVFTLDVLHRRASIAELVARERPAFVAGRVTCDAASVLPDLPDMEH